jgi:hypothetical protein
MNTASQFSAFFDVLDRACPPIVNEGGILRSGPPDDTRKAGLRPAF